MALRTVRESGRIRRQRRPTPVIHFLSGALRGTAHAGIVWLALLRLHAGRLLFLLRGRAPAAGRGRRVTRIAFPSCDAPQVSIVIPVFNHLDTTLACLASVVGAGCPCAYEVIVVNDASTDETARVLASIPNLRLLSNERNEGFIAACNHGAAVARGAYLLFLNNDAELTPGSVASLLETFRRFPEAGLAGPKLVYPGGVLQEAGGIVWRDGSAWNYGKYGFAGRPEYGYVREADYCSGACLMIPRDLFSEIGKFDPLYAPAYYEDTDLAFKVRAAGRKVYYQPFAEVVHHEGVTCGRRTGAGVKRAQVENQRRFQQRWKDVLARHAPNGVRPDLEKDRAAKRRVLVVDHRMLTPDRDSGSVRMWRMLHILRELGCKVTFSGERPEARQPYAAELQADGIEVLYPPYVTSLRRYLRKYGKRYDTILLSRVDVARKHLAACRACCPHAMLIFDTVDLHFLREQREAELSGERKARKAAARRKKQEIAAMRKAHVTLVVSPVEKELLARAAPDVRVEQVSNIHSVCGPSNPFEQRRDLLFVGGFEHPPNADAVLWFAREILPRVRERLGDVRFYVVGDGPPPAVRDLAGEAVVVTGHVPDLVPYLRDCRLSVAPLRYGAGVKGKINSSMSYGLPVVATSVACEGMQLADGKDVLIAESPADFAEAVVRLYRDPDLWAKLSDGGVANIRRHFSAEAAAATLRRILFGDAAHAASYTR